MLVFEPFNAKGFNPTYPDAMKIIIDYMESHGKLNVDYSYLEKLWYEFSDVYEAGFLEPDDVFLKEFVQWLDGREVEESQKTDYDDYDRWYDNIRSHLPEDDDEPTEPSVYM